MVLTKLFINVGYFIKINDTEILYDEIGTLLVFVLAIIGLFQYGINKKVFYIFMSFVFFMVLSLILNSFYYEDIYGISFDNSWDTFFYTKNYIFNRGVFSLLKPTTRSFLMLFRVIMCLTSFSVFLKLADFEVFHKILMKIYRVSLIMIVLSLIEFVLKNFYHSSYLNDFYLQIFGESMATKTGLGAQVNSIYATICLFREQSILAVNFSVAAIMLLFLYKSDKNKKVLITSGFLIAVSIISMSFTSILFVITYVIFLIYIFDVKINKITGVIGLTVLIVAIIATVNYVQANDVYMSRIRNCLLMLFHYDDNMNIAITSENIRLYSIMFNLNIFFKHFLFGIGIGTSYCFSGLVSSLVSIGAVGIIQYFYLIKKYFEIFSNRKLKVFSVLIICITMFFIGGIEFLYSELWLLIYSLDSCYKSADTVKLEV